MKQTILVTLGALILGASGTALADGGHRHGDHQQDRHDDYHDRVDDRHDAQHDRGQDRHDEFHDQQAVERAGDYYWYGDDGWTLYTREAERARDHRQFHRQQRVRHNRQHRRAAVRHRMYHWDGWRWQPAPQRPSPRPYRGR